MVVIQYRAQEFLVKSRERQILTLRDYLSPVWISRSLSAVRIRQQTYKDHDAFPVLCLAASAPGWKGSKMAFLVGYILTHVRTCKRKGRKENG